MQNVLTENEIKRRLPLWSAISDLWLDVEPDETLYNYIVREIIKSGYSIEQVERIYSEEVAPAVYHNLHSVAGEWTYFDEDWLREKILQNLQKQQTNLIHRLFVKSSLGKKIMTGSLAANWAEILKRYQQTLKTKSI